MTTTPDAELVNTLLEQYGRELYRAGCPYNHYAETVNAVQSRRPRLRRCLQPAWDLAYAWLRQEPPSHSLALPWQALLSLLTSAWMWGWSREAGVVALSWGGVTRIGEVLSACWRDLVLPIDVDYSINYALLQIAEPKTRYRCARRQIAKLDHPQLLQVIEVASAHLAPSQKLWPASGQTMRGRFQKLLKANSLLELPEGISKGIDVASEDSELARRRGRWIPTKIMEIYVQEAWAVQFLPHLPAKVKSKFLQATVKRARLPVLMRPKGSWTGVRKQRQTRMQAIEELKATVRGQQAQMSILSRRQVQLREEGEALRECLEASGALAPVRFLARLHRRRFAEVIKRHPGPWPGSLDAVMQIRELALATAASAGAASVAPLAAASRALRAGVGSMLSEFPALFPSQVYAIGGADSGAETLSSVEKFDSKSCVWETVSPLAEPRESCAAVAANSMIYVLGGVNAESQCLNTVECFSPQTGTWEPMPPMRHARAAAAAAACGGQVYVIGGRDGFQCLDSVERFDPVARRWRLQASLRSARLGAAACVLGGGIYVIGGKGGGRVLDSVERLEHENSFWEILPSLHARRYRCASAAAHGRVYRFDPATGTWEPLPPMKVPRKFCGAATCRD
eukprot:g13509.t1